MRKVSEWVKNPNDAQKLQPVYEQVEQHEAEDGYEAIWRMLKNGLKACLYVGSVTVVGLALTAAGVSPTFSFEIVNSTVDLFKSFQKQEETRLAIEYRQQIQLGTQALKQDDEDAAHDPLDKDRPEM